ncbi:MAG: crossover junction endodeoxyribonuclease RuvC [Gemmatimonadetes bacterium]|nr:crossover junction endodeoxyribonuclease RuvC [Gemmatimonadota bacterium]MDE2734764.1 crossover junction endodeoxyribonuclease RuvC [Gemmatimonadota bacterium]
MLVLGVDPSSTSTGYGFVEYSKRKARYVACGCIRPKEDAFEDRLVYMFDEMTRLIDEYAPDEGAIETTFFGKDATAAAKLGQARGVLIVAMRKAGLPIAHYTPAVVKRSVTGNGQATKQQVQFMVARRLGLEEVPKPLDASDALAIVLCHTQQSGRVLCEGRGQRKPEIEALLSRMVRR